VDSLQKRATDTVTQNQQTVKCEVLTDTGETVEGSCGHNDTEPTNDSVRSTDKLDRMYKVVV